MSKLKSRIALPPLPRDASKYDRELQVSLTRFTQEVSQQVNRLSEGRINARGSDSGTPTSTVVKYNQGDFVWNNKPVEVTATGSSYVVLGWTNEIAGSPGTWREARVKTGN